MVCGAFGCRTVFCAKEREGLRFLWRVKSVRGKLHKKDTLKL